jgi:DNA-binding response OmpR family regulator
MVLANQMRMDSMGLVLLCGGDRRLLSQLETQVFDFRVARCATGQGTLEAVSLRRPAAVLVTDDGAAVPSVLRSLQESELPIVVLTDDGSLTNVARWFRRGASEVCPAEALDDAMLRSTSSTSALHGFESWARRRVLSGTIAVMQGTPLEGIARFEGGELQRASFCWLEGQEALAEMLAMEDCELKAVDDGQSMPAVRAYSPRVLVVEDDEALREILVRVIERDGYRVFQARNGLEALGIAQRERLDAVVSDLNMPQLDGWGLLRVLREEMGTSEVPIMLLSAHSESVDILKAARAGARAYLKKTGRSREMLDALSLLTRGRQQVWTALREGEDVDVELRNVGSTWLLETLAELDAQGRLELEDELGRYEVTVSGGKLVEAAAQTGSLRTIGHQALQAALTSRARGCFRFNEVHAPAGAPWVFEAVSQVLRALSEAAANRLKEALLSPQAWRLDPELLALYSRVASARELRLLEGLQQAPGTVDELAHFSALSTSDVTRIVGEFMRRGIVVSESA